MLGLLGNQNSTHQILMRRQSAGNLGKPREREENHNRWLWCQHRPRNKSQKTSHIYEETRAYQAHLSIVCNHINRESACQSSTQDKDRMWAVERGKQKSLYHHVGHLTFMRKLPSIHTVDTSFTIKETYINAYLCHSKKITGPHSKS